MSVHSLGYHIGSFLSCFIPTSEYQHFILRDWQDVWDHAPVNHVEVPISHDLDLSEDQMKLTQFLTLQWLLQCWTNRLNLLKGQRKMNPLLVTECSIGQRAGAAF